MTDVNPFEPGPSWDELAAQHLGSLIVHCPEDKTAPDGTLVPRGTPLTVRQAQELGINVVVELS